MSERPPVVLGDSLKLQRLQAGDWVPGPHMLDRVISANITVPGDKTMLTHDSEIADGVEITIEDGGEVLWI